MVLGISIGGLMTGSISLADQASGIVSRVGTGIGLVGGPITTDGNISLANTSVTPGSYSFPAITVDQQGRLTSVTERDDSSLGLYGTTNQVSVACSGICIFSLPSTVVAPGSIAATSTLQGAPVYNTDVTGGHNTVYGPSSGTNIATGATYNSIFGPSAGNGITTTSYNIAVGDGTLGGPGAIGNVAIGHQAGRLSQCDGWCTFVGYEAGWNAIAPPSSGGFTAVGNTALWSATNCSLCTALGDRTLPAYTENTGVITAVGASAGLSLKTGNANTYVGAQAALWTVTDTQSTVVGTFAMQNFICSSNNVAVGYGALYGGGTACGAANTAVGSKAMYNAINATFNVAVGNSAALAMVQSQYVTCIGYAACFSLPINGSQAVIIGGFASPTDDGGSTTCLGYATSCAFRGTSVGYQASNTGQKSTVVGALAKDNGNGLCGAFGFQAACTASNQGNYNFLTNIFQGSATAIAGFSSSGNITFTPGSNAAAGSGATAVCASGLLCDIFSGTVTFAAGTSVSTTGILLTILMSTTRAKAPNCVVSITGGTTYLAPSWSTTTSTVAVSVGVAVSSSATYTVSYVCGGI
jgi:hypothetical protein